MIQGEKDIKGNTQNLYGARPQIVGYSLHGNRYLNISSRCTLRCTFCPKFNGVWDVRGHDLRLQTPPTVEEILVAAGDPRRYRDVVFCGLGEPTQRLYTLLEVAKQLREQGARVRLNTDGLANLTHGRDVTPDLEGNIDAMSVSLNAQNAAIYNRHCRPRNEGAYESMFDFVERARSFVPEITLTAIDGLSGVDIAACEGIARRFGVGFRRRVLGAVG